MNRLGGFDSRECQTEWAPVTRSKVFGTGKRTASREAKSAAKFGTVL